MDFQPLVSKMDAMVSQGDIVNAVKTYFADHASTSDYGRVTTRGKQQMVEKMEGFLNSIAEVKDIRLHRSIVEGNVSASEFTFHFDMKDGSEIYWHEIIRRIWNDDGQVVAEEYFNAQN